MAPLFHRRKLPLTLSAEAVTSTAQETRDLACSKQDKNKLAVKQVLFVSSVRQAPYKKAAFTHTINVLLGN